MVLSRLNKTIEYTDKTKIDEKDKNLESELYQFALQEYKFSIMIAIGKYNVNKNVLFLPIYLFHNDKFISQVGVFEIEITKERENEKDRNYGILHKNGNVIIERLHQPLFYSFATKEFLERYKTKNIHTHIQTNKGANWIRKYMNDKDYDTIHTEMDYNGDSDCLFTAIKIALSDVKRYVSVLSMREMVAKNVTKSIFDIYKSNYNSAEKELNKIKTVVKDLIERNKYYENKIKNTNVRNERLILVKEAEENIKRFNDAKREIVFSTDKYKNVSFMKHIDTVEQLKTLVKSNDFYADMWTISVIEREMNIKLVLFSQEAYISGDIYNVLDCKNEHNNLIAYNPDYYILIGYMKKDYQLITYRRRCAFDFEHLNSQIKELIIDKINERNGGLYSHIKAFNNVNANTNGNVNVNGNANVKAEIHSDLYNGESVFQIYENANDTFEPGRGVGEKLDKREIDNYKELRSIESWRRTLAKYMSITISMSSKEMETFISREKELQIILRHTNNAKLVCFQHKNHPIDATILMKMRKYLRSLYK